MTERHSAFCSPLPDYIHHSRDTTILFKITEWHSLFSSQLLNIHHSLHDYRMTFTSLFTIKSDIHQSLHDYGMTFTSLFTIKDWHSSVSSRLQKGINHFVRHYRMSLTILSIFTNAPTSILLTIRKWHSPLCSPLQNSLQNYMHSPFSSPLQDDTYHYVHNYKITFAIL